MSTSSDNKILTESFHNFLPSDTAQKEVHANEVYKILQDAYEDQGGIKGSGFSSPRDMVNIPLWKINKKNGKINSVVMYKDTAGRKVVAMGTDGSLEGKRHVTNATLQDVHGRSHMEISGKALAFIKKQSSILDHVIPFDSAKNFHNSRGDIISRPAHDDPEVIRHPELKSAMYVRNIGGHPHTKVMIGRMGNQITERTLTKDEEIINGQDSALSPKKQTFGKWEMDPQIHGPSQAKERRPEFTQEHWGDLLTRSHEALTDTSKHLGKPAKVTGSDVLVYSKKLHQGVVYRLEKKDQNNIKLGGKTRIQTVLPKNASQAKEGTQRIVIESIQDSDLVKLVIEGVPYENFVQIVLIE